MKRSLIVAIVLCAFITADAQQDPQYTQWMFDKLSFNPGAAGFDNGHCGSMFYRSQWDQFNRGPKTGMFNYSGRFGDNVGLGLTFYNDHLGQEVNSIFRVAGAYHYVVPSNAARITGGLSFGIMSKRLGDDWIAIDDPNFDPVIKPLLNGKKDNAIDLNLGFMYYKENEYYVGLSATHLYTSDYSDLGIEVAPHMYIMGGYNFQLGSPDLVLRTNLLTKTDLKATAFDFNANVLWNNMLWGGLTYRHQDAIALMAGYQTELKGDGSDMLKVGYSYDMTTSEIRNYSAGSHELFVKYCIIITPVPQIYRYGHPRFLGS